MPPSHGDAPLGHGTRRILFGYGSENPSGFLIEERVQQGDAAVEFGLHRRCS